MLGIERDYCYLALLAITKAWGNLCQATIEQALAPVSYGKGDTLGLDGIPEIIIGKILHSHDPQLILLTEEATEMVRKRWPTESSPLTQPTLMASDPTDGSKQMSELLQMAEDQTARVGDFLARDETEPWWEGRFGKPAVATGASTSLTCVRNGKAVVSVFLNYITGTLILSCAEGIFRFQLNKTEFAGDNDSIDLDEIITKGTPVIFPGFRHISANHFDYFRFVACMANDTYAKNLAGCLPFIAKEMDTHRHAGLSVGPTRFMYLSDAMDLNDRAGIIIANGERLPEFIHWCSIVRNAKDKSGENELQMFELRREDYILLRDGVLMTPPPGLSIFHNSEVDQPSGYIDLARIKFPSMVKTPADYRATLLVAHRTNDRLATQMKMMGIRPVNAIL